MNKRKIKICIFLLMITSGMLFAQTKVDNHSVMLIGKVKINNPERLQLRKDIMPGAFKKIIPSYSVELKEKSMFNNITNCWDLGDYCFYKVNKNKRLMLSDFQGNLSNRHNYCFFNLPAKCSIVAPEGAKYIYIGTWDYELDDALRVVNFHHLDDYSEAKKLVEEKFGNNEELVRGEIVFLDD